MAGSVAFGPQVNISHTRRTSAKPPTGRGRFVVPSRSASSTSVNGGGNWHKWRIAAQESLEPYVFETRVTP